MTTLMIPTNKEPRLDPKRIVPPIKGCMLWWDAFLSTHALRNNNLIKGKPFKAYTEDAAGSGYTRLNHSRGSTIVTDLIMPDEFSALMICRVQAAQDGRVINNVGGGGGQGLRISHIGSPDGVVFYYASSTSQIRVNLTALRAAGYTDGDWLLIDIVYSKDNGSSLRVVNYDLSASTTNAGASAPTYLLNLGGLSATGTFVNGDVDICTMAIFDRILPSAEKEQVIAQLRARAAKFSIIV